MSEQCKNFRKSQRPENAKEKQCQEYEAYKQRTVYKLTGPDQTKVPYVKVESNGSQVDYGYDENIDQSER